jgi:predicted dehydrogenase
MMNLTPEQKKVGKENFDEATGALYQRNRRDFLKEAGLVLGAGAAVGLGARYFGYGPKLDDRLRVGIIGTGDEGNVLIGALNPDYIDVVAIADIRPYSIYRAFHGDWYSPGARAARPGLMKVYGYETENDAQKHVKVYTGDYMELIDDPNVEAVIIATPLFMHHPMAINALRKGKHVLTEKLMGHNVALCKEMARVAAESTTAGDTKNPLVMAVGHQRHYSILYDNAVEQIRQGLIGDIHHIRAQWHRDNAPYPKNDSWKPVLPGDKHPKTGEDLLLKELGEWQKKLADLRSTKSTKPETITEWEMKIAQKEAQVKDITEELAAKYGYQATTIDGRPRPAVEELIRWRLWNRTAAGLMAELGSHQLDASSIFISAQDPEEDPTKRHVHPLAVTAFGNRSIFPLDRDCEDHVYCMFEFPGKGYYKEGSHEEVADPNKKVVVTYSSINGNGYGGYGEIVFGTDGTLILEQEQDAMLFKGSNTATQIEVKDNKAGQPVMDTYETGGGAALAQATSGGPVSRGYKEEIEHWAWCIRNPDPKHQPRCTPTVALGDAVVALTANLAIARNQRIEFQPAWFDPTKDATPDDIKPRAADDVKV